MVEEIVKFPTVATWFIGILLTIISALVGFVLWYVLQLIKEARGLGGKISKNTYEILGLKQETNELLSEIHSSNKSVWEELHKLRGSVVSGTMVLQRRKAEVSQILEDTKRAKDKLAAHDQLFTKGIKVLRRHRSELTLLRSRVQNISEDVLLIKEENAKNNGSKK